MANNRIASKFRRVGRKNWAGSAGEHVFPANAALLSSCCANACSSVPSRALPSVSREAGVFPCTLEDHLSPAKAGRTCRKWDGCSRANEGVKEWVNLGGEGREIGMGSLKGAGSGVRGVHWIQSLS